MEKHSIKKKIRLIIWISAVLLLFIMLMNFSANLYISHLFKEQVRKFESETSGFYKIKYGRIRVNILFNRITLNHFNLFPKSDLESKPISNPQPDRFYRIEFSLLKIKGVSLCKYIFSKSLNIRRLILKNPKITVFNRSGNASKSDMTRSLNRDITIPLKLRGILVRFIHIKNGSYSLVNHQKKRKTTNSIDFIIRDLKLGFHLPRSGPPILKPESLDFIANRIKFNLPDKLYSVSIEEMGFSATMGKMWMRSLMLIPRYPKYSFSRKVGYRIARKSLKMEWLHLHGIDLAGLIKKNIFKSRLLSARGVHVEFFSNRQVPPRTGMIPRKFPQQYLRDLKLQLHIEKAKISNGYIGYEEGIDKSKKAARIFFSQVKIDIYNITNIPGISSGLNEIRIRASSKFMNRADFYLNIGLSIHDKRDRFTFGGNMKAIRGSILNPILRNNSIHIERGHLNSVYFQASGNHDETRGRMKLYYKKLKISLLRKRKLNRKDKLTSFFINRIIQSNNPRRHNHLRIGNMYYQRKRAKSIFNLMWKSFLAGVKSSIGLKKKKK